MQQTSKWQTHGAQEHKFPRWFADGIKKRLRLACGAGAG